MKTIILILIFSGISICNISAQVSQQWVARYNSQDTFVDIGNAVALDGSGNIYVVGSSRSVSGSGVNYNTVKYNSMGIQQWVRTYHSPTGDTHNFDIVTDAAGNVYVTGGAGFISTYVTIKYNPNGDSLWTRIYKGPNDTGGVSNKIAVDAIGNVYVTGNNRGLNTGRDFATVKYNASGVQLWVARYSAPGYSNDNATSLFIDATGNVYVTGSSGVSPVINYATIKYNSVGEQQWVEIYDGTGNSDVPSCVKTDALGNVYVTGTSVSGITGGDYATIKYTSSGVMLWTRRYTGGGNNADIARDMVIDNTGNIYITGELYTSSITRSDISTMKYTPTGDTVWVKNYNGLSNSFDTGNKIALDNAGNIYVTGGSRDSAFNTNYTTLKYDPSGQQQWIQKYNGPGNDYDNPTFIKVDASGYVYITGVSLGSGTNFDFATIKYTQPVGIHTISSEVPDKFSLSQNYPNPFNPTTNFEFQIPDRGWISLKVFNILGKEVETLINGELTAGLYKYTWDATRQTSGVYLYKLSAGGYSEVKKMILIK